MGAVSGRTDPGSLRIGGLTIDPPVLLAPMAGVADAPFRQICREMSCPAAVTEMVSAKALYYASRGTERLLAREEGPGLLGVQLFGSEPELMGEMAARIEDRFDWIDLNMGCPVPKVVGNGEGSALLLEPEKISRIVEAVVRHVHRPVTVKIRKGFDPAHDFGTEIARRIEDAGAAAVAVHARFRSEYYGGKADWEAIARIVRSVSIPVIGNGDVFSAGDALRMRAETGCAGVMIARGAEGDPWIFRECAAAFRGEPLPSRPTREETAAVIRRHGKLHEEAFGARGYAELRKHLAWYTAGQPCGAVLRREAMKVDSAEGLENWVKLFLMIDREASRGV